MRSYFKRYLILIVLAILTAPSLYCEMPKKDQSFYAISSLCFHLKTILSNPKKDIFSVEDISKLWNSACENKEMSTLISARDLYYQSQNEKEDEAHLLLTEAQIVLENAWKQSNPYYRHPDKVVSKGVRMIKNGVENAIRRSYILPVDSPLRAPLDTIFRSPQIMKDSKSFFKAGFQLVSQRKTGMVVVKHPLLKGYLIKAHPGKPTKKKTQSWKWLVFRCWGVANIQKLIRDKKIKYFVTPNKWIYPLGKYKLGKDGDYTQVQSPAVLVVTDMNLATKQESKKAWKSKVSKKHIRELFLILSHGYSSCNVSENIPLTKNGKFTCIDTENPQKRSPSFSQLEFHLSKKMKRYFFKLLKSGGKELDKKIKS